MQLLSDVKDLSGIGYGFIASKTLFAALDLELFTHLADGALSADALQRRTEAAPNALRTLLRACTSLGLIGRDGERYYNSPAAAQYLAKTSPRYFGDYFRYQIDRQIYPSLHELGDALKGRPTTPMYARMASPAEAELFSTAQHVGSLGPAHLLAQRLDGSTWTRLLDVAGGSGAFSIALCRRNPQLRATILDFEAVVPIARRFVEQAGLSARISAIAGEALATPWPEGQDAVLMSYLLSAMPAPSFGPLLRKAFQALRPGGALLIHDFMLDEARHGPPHAALWFVANLINGPQQVSFSAGDLATLLLDSGFAEPQGTDLLEGLTGLLSARKPQ
jgi:ubiquinone/menaquinone biosynthesis C-methylase UbiE